MAEPEVVVDEGDAGVDEEMRGVEGVEDTGIAENGDPSGLEDIEPTVPERITFLE